MTSALTVRLQHIKKWTSHVSTSFNSRGGYTSIRQARRKPWHPAPFFYGPGSELALRFKPVVQFIGSIAVEMDPEQTGVHLLRTSRHLGRLCRTMKASGEYDLSEMDINAASTCSILHDVGKVSIPGGILHKPERLTEFEWGIIKNHVVSGLELAETLKLPKMATDIIAYHHCRWDGVRDRWDATRQMRDSVRGGYPFCAKGPDIPVLARAFAYVDIFDALITPRSYRPAWSVWEAAGYIRDNLVGTQLDPGIHPSFIQSLEWVVC